MIKQIRDIFLEDIGMMGEKQINAMIINEKDHVIMTTETVKKGRRFATGIQAVVTH